MTDTNNILGENMLPLAEIAKPVFNITPRIAQRKAATNTLPVPAFHGPHPSSEAAESWAYEHDPEM